MSVSSGDANDPSNAIRGVGLNRQQSIYRLRTRSTSVDASLFRVSAPPDSFPAVDTAFANIMHPNYPVQTDSRTPSDSSSDTEVPLNFSTADPSMSIFVSDGLCGADYPSCARRTTRRSCRTRYRPTCVPYKVRDDLKDTLFPDVPLICELRNT